MFAREAARINILIVDDEPKNLSVLETLLDDARYRIVRAESADKALLALIADEFALLILDVRMPGMNGLELAHMIKARKKTAHVPIIFLSAYYNEDQHPMEAYSTGAVDFLHKPVNASILRSKVAVFAELHLRNLENAAVNRELLAEIAQRRQISEQLSRLNETLEERVRERTEALREKELRLRQAADSARLTYVEVDFLHGQVRKAENFATVMGYSPTADEEAQMASGPGQLILHVLEQDRERVAQRLSANVSATVPAKIDYRVLGENQVVRWIQSEWFVESDADGKPESAILINLDVTERKEAGDRLRESEERYRQLADSMPQMVWTANGSGELDYYNARWCEFTEIGPEQYGNFANWLPMLHPNDADRTISAWRTSVNAGTPYRAECRLWDRRLNCYAWYLGSAVPVRNDLGQVVRWIGTCTEIDEQKRTEEALRRANLALEDFAYAASHDLQEPLRNMAIYTQLLKHKLDAQLTVEAAGFMKVIIDGAQRMARLVSDLLAFTEVSNFDRREVSAIDANEVLDRVLIDLEQAALESGAEITRDELPSVSVQEVHLQQLFQNLVGNALKYRRDGRAPRVHISAHRQTGEWQFCINDNGIGVAPEHREKIFGIFKRLHAKGGKYEGTGIGLAICQRIVGNYGGRIWLESEVGQGTTCHFTIPYEATFH